MGLFMLSRETSADALGAPWLAAHQRHGFTERRDLTAAGWRLNLFGKLNGSAPQLFERSSGEFAACSGVLFYRGAATGVALDRLLEDFDGRRFPWSECRGHFAVLIHKFGQLYLATDALGAYKVYHDGERHHWSSSFTAIRQTLPDHPKADPQGVYEYAWNGATYGTRTFLRDIHQLRRGSLLRFGQTVELLAEETVLDCQPAPARSLDETAEDYAARLRALFRVYACGGGQFRTALSGGYDSRLMLALLLDAGLTPQIYVYGRDNDDDVQVAKAIAHGEGLKLEHVDKSQQAPPASAARIERAWVRFDGWKNDGLFDSGVDAEDRLVRAPRGVSVLNGSAGEIFRNFFYLPERAYRPVELVWSFYSRIDPRTVTPAFDLQAYESAMALDLSKALGHDGQKRFSRIELEALYPLHRARYWTARDVGLNQRFGPLLFPFMEAAVMRGTEAIPLSQKNYGVLEAKIIERISPALARYPSAYGYVPIQGPSLRYRLKMQATFQRPPWLRRWSYRMQQWRAPRLTDEWLQAARLAEGLDPALPAMREFFKPEAVRDADVLNRICTMELALQGLPQSFTPHSK